jgi:hypothetical protein
MKENRLAIRGEKQTNDEEKIGDVLYQGIAARTFERSFQLADYVKVKGASLENGLAAKAPASPAAGSSAPLPATALLTARSRPRHCAAPAASAPAPASIS